MRDLGDTLEQKFGVPVRDIRSGFDGFLKFAGGIPGDLAKMFTTDSGPAIPKDSFVEEPLAPLGEPSWLDGFYKASSNIKNSITLGFN